MNLEQPVGDLDTLPFVGLGALDLHEDLVALKVLQGEIGRALALVAVVGGLRDNFRN
jgi:hypothetical protein